MNGITKGWVKNQPLNFPVVSGLGAESHINRTRIAVEGLQKEILSLVCQMLERLYYDICYRHESAYRRINEYVFTLLENPSDIVRNIVDA